MAPRGSARGPTLIGSLLSSTGAGGLVLPRGQEDAGDRTRVAVGRQSPAVMAYVLSRNGFKSGSAELGKASAGRTIPSNWKLPRTATARLPYAAWPCSAEPAMKPE